MKKYVLMFCLATVWPTMLVAQSVPDMLEKALPAVVTVAVYKAQRVATPFGFATRPTDVAYQQALDLADSQSTGSGFVIAHEGTKYVVTNAHVVENALADKGAIVVYSINRTKYNVKVVGGDTLYDFAVLAFLEQAPGEELGVLKFRNSPARVGEPVFAIGNPFGDHPYTVTDGIIGGKNRFLGGGTTRFGYLQTTAILSPGNSGGPLVDPVGEVVGINTAILQHEGAQQPQFNFAIEGPLAERLVRELLANQGRVRRPFLGLALAQNYSAECQLKTCRWSTADPVPRIAAMLPNTPAAAALAGKEGYRVVKIGEAPVRNTAEALGELEKLSPGSEVTLELEHAGGRQQVTLQAAELTRERLGALATFLLGCYGGTSLASGQDSVVFRLSQVRVPEAKPSASCGQRATIVEHTKSGKEEAGAEISKEDMPVVAAGLMHEEEAEAVWRVKNLDDLGVAVRLAAMSGYIDFIAKSEKALVARRLWLSGNKETLTKVLLY